MIDIQLLRKDIDNVAARLATRKFVLDVAGFNALEAERKAIQTRTEELQGKRNSLSKQIGMLKGKGEDTTALMSEVSGLGDELKANETALTVVQACGALRAPEARRELLAVMESLVTVGWLRPEPQSNPARPPSAWAVNPVLHTAFAERAGREREVRRRAQQEVSETIRLRRPKGD